ncbi:(deoxy)nucleoside triphosphate pyrophosphohydrolase [Sphingobacterium sp.]|uniref:(deoxy)nucleoside triphosphate pyrophosphohydrolase n=1 Tax=Sphingobacterium sp. TaxID=341027 RepID=UPI0031DB25C1
MIITKVVCGIIFYNDEVLICRRKPEKSLGGYWEFPGGKVEIGEDYFEALKREVKEELDFEIIVDDYFFTVTHLVEGNLIDLISFLCTGTKREIKSTDHDKVEWVKYTELLNWNLSPADIQIAKELIEDFARIDLELKQDEDEFNAPLN